MQSTPERELVNRAVQGDRAAFDKLAGPQLPRLRRYLKRSIGHPEDCEDVLQEALASAWTGIGSFRADSAFSTWLTAIAVRAATDHLRQQKRWRAGAQVALANLCARDEARASEVMAISSDPGFAFEIREHIAYCFACVGRSQPPDEQAALVLRDVLGLSARESATVLGVSDSVLRHRLAAARGAMTETYQGLCALVSKTGICHQCSSLAQLAAEDRRGNAVPDLAGLAERAAIARAAEPGAMSALHDLFWRRTKEIEEEGTVSAEPESDCGESVRSSVYL